MEYSFWRRQTQEEPLFPAIEWAKPEQRSLAGKLGIIGGSSLGFAGVAEAYSVAQHTGVGAIRVLLPDTVKKTMPLVIPETVFTASNPSGSLSKEAAVDMKALGAWADGILFAGDAGRNSETAILYESFLKEFTGPVTVTRDAIDLIKNNATLLVERPQTLIVASFAQLQKLFQAVYYPKVLTFSMHLTQLVEALHKFTTTYPVTIMVLHQDTLITAHNGDVVTTPWQNAMAIWRGSVAASASAYWLWHPNKPLEAITASLVTSNR